MRILPSCQGKQGKDGAGPSPITAQLLFQAMNSMSPGGLSSVSANNEHAKDQNDHQLQNKDQHDTAKG
jgi:hypothetical protein